MSAPAAAMLLLVGQIYAPNVSAPSEIAPRVCWVPRTIEARLRCTGDKCNSESGACDLSLARGKLRFACVEEGRSDELTFQVTTRRCGPVGSIGGFSFVGV